MENMYKIFYEAGMNWAKSIAENGGNVGAFVEYVVMETRVKNYEDEYEKDEKFEKFMDILVEKQMKIKTSLNLELFYECKGDWIKAKAFFLNGMMNYIYK